MKITPFKGYQQIQPEERVALASLHFRKLSVVDFGLEADLFAVVSELTKAL